MIKTLPAILLFLVLLSSCISNKRLVYIHDKSFGFKEPYAIENKESVYHLQSGDVVNIRIKTLDPESSSYFNIFPEQGVLNYNSPGIYINSYSIDLNGNIDIPGAGFVKVLGLTLEESQKLVKDALQKYLNNATVILKLVSFKITVLGEVKSPGYYFVYNNKANLLEALGLAGDLTDFGNRDNITLIRQTEKGSQAILINLRNADILQSPYYNLKPNDVIYVQPLRAKSARGNLNTLQILSLVFAGLTSTILVLDYVNPR